MVVVKYSLAKMSPPVESQLGKEDGDEKEEEEEKKEEVRGRRKRKSQVMRKKKRDDIRAWVLNEAEVLGMCDFLLTIILVSDCSVHLPNS